MSKINPIQAEALKATVTATAPVKPAASKPVLAKKPAAKKNTEKTTASAVKPVTAKAAPTKSVKAKVEKPIKEKTPKLKMERDSFTMPKSEYAQFSVLKERLLKLGQPAKKSELLRAGIMQLTAMTDAALKAAMSKVPTIKTGRPKK
ncbi:MAG: hypothetical protein V4445_09340 [Pseudomonadota bacterium]